MMDYQLLGITVLWIFLFGYMIVASIDFGAGFFSYYSTVTGKKSQIHEIIDRYLSPVWEVTNVFLIFFMVGFVGFFPDSAYYFGTALLLPGSFAIILLAIRGSYYAFNNYGTKENRLYLLLYGASGLLIPASLSTVLTISEGGFIGVQDGKVILLYRTLFTSPYSWAVVLLALVSVLYISAMFLTYYAAKAKDLSALRILRGYALAWGMPTILASLLVFFAIREHNPDHYARMLDYSWMFVLSFLCFIGGFYLVWRGLSYGWAFILVMVQFALAFFGYGVSHLPSILYPYIDLYDNFTNRTMALYLIGAFIAGLMLLIPSLYLLMRLFLFNATYVEGGKSKKG
jgi:cytochrome d ubiquinol oxidase subunit II